MGGQRNGRLEEWEVEVLILAVLPLRGAGNFSAPGFTAEVVLRQQRGIFWQESAARCFIFAAV